MDNYGKLQSKGERAEVIFCQTLTLCMKDLEKICMTVFSICIDYIFPTKIRLPLLMHRKDGDLERRLGLAHFQSLQLR